MRITEQLPSLRYCQMRGRRKHDARVTGFATDLRITEDSEQLPPVRSIPYNPWTMMRTEKRRESRRRRKFSAKDFSLVIMPLLISVEEIYASEQLLLPIGRSETPLPLSFILMVAIITDTMKICYQFDFYVN